jgi:hypothetical protein
MKEERGSAVESLDNITTGWFITWLADIISHVDWVAESVPITQEREARDSIIQRFKDSGSTTHDVASSRSIILGETVAGPKAQRASICSLARTAGCGAPGVVAGHLAGAGHHTETLAASGLNAGLLAATVERGAQLAGAGRAAGCGDQVA